MSAETEADDVSAERTLRITSAPWASFKSEALERARQFDEGEADEAESRVLNFEDPTQIQRILTPKRLELIRAVMEASPESIRQLADQLDRNVSDVFDDVHLLEEYGILQLEEAGRAKQPVIPYDSIRIEVELSPPGDREDTSTAVS